MFERYTSELHKAIFVATQVASDASAGALEPEHVLAGVVKIAPHCLATQRDSDSAFVDLLARLGVNSTRSDVVRATVEIPFSPATKRVFREALETADRLEHRWIRTEHMLLALLHEEGCVAARVLQEIGIDQDLIAANATGRAPAEDEPIPTGPRVILVKAD